MDHIEHGCHMLKPGDKMCSADLKSVYDHLRIRQSDQKYLRFHWKGDTYQYLVVPNGIQIGPWVFCRAASALTSYLRRLSIQIILYLDDSFVCADSIEKLKEHMDIVLNTFVSAGLTVNYEKSHLNPSTHLDFLSFLLDSDAFTISVLLHKRQLLQQLIQTALCSPKISMCFFARIIGIIVSFLPACIEARLHYRDLDRHKTIMLRWKGNWNAKITLLCRVKMVVFCAS